MRPRPDAAENAVGEGAIRAWFAGFNEAAARCRGKPREHRQQHEGRHPRFNEAAARCRGKPRRASPRVSRSHTLQ